MSAMTKEQLTNLEIEIAQCEPLARAEEAFRASNPEATNPWSGQAARLEALRAAREDCLLIVAGERLNAALEKRQELQQRLDDLTLQRQVCDRNLAELAAHPTVQRYKAATLVCMSNGWGRSWEMFRDFFQSNRSLRQGCHESDVFFLRDEAARAANVQFNLEDDRKVIHAWIEAKGNADLALLQWNDCAARLRELLREHPELQAVN